MLKVDTKLLAECLNELLIDTCEFDIGIDSPTTHNGQKVSVLEFKKYFYNGSQGRGLLIFKIGNKTYCSPMVYDSWDREIETNVHFDSLTELVEGTDSSSFDNLLKQWQDDWDKEIEAERLYWDDFSGWGNS